MNDKVAIQPEHAVLVKTILQRYLPTHTTLWVFGSRVKGKSKKFSDLDIAIDCGERVSTAVMANIAFDLEESDLPYKVDVVDLNAVSETFKKIIAKDGLAL